MIGVALLAGLALGGGIWLTARGFAPPPRPIAAALADLHRPRWSDESAPDWESRARGWATMLTRSTGVSTTTDRNLVLVGRTVERHALDKLIYSLLGAVLPVAGWLIMSAGSVSAPLAIPVVFGLAMGAGGFLLPDALLRGEAATYRRDFNAQLAVYLDLVVVLLAGGRGVDGALTSAAAMGDSAAFIRIRRTLAAAQLNRESPWRALDRLANTLGIAALAELAASVTLAGESGARVRESLAAKAESIRARLLSETEADAHRRSETMSGPVVMMLTGFVLLVGFPAVYALMTF